MRLKTTKVKTAKNRSTSSTQWLNRQLNDPFVIQSKIDGYRSRSAYKLVEIDEKYKILKKNLRVIDLGAAPGGWCQVIASKLNSSGKILAVDLLEMDEILGVDIMQGDFCDPEIQKNLIDKLAGKADLILSDMAPNTTGHKATDHLRIMDLCERVFYFAKNTLNQGGTIVIKIFQGGAESQILALIKKDFSVVKHYKPESSRKDSSEIYLVATGFRG